MILLVTTSKSFIALDSDTGKADIIHTGNGLYYGITFSDDAIFVAARKSLDCFNYLHDRANENGSILVFDYSLKLIDTLHAPFPLRDIHQIFMHDEKLWITCAFDDMIAIYDFPHWQQWYPSGEQENLGQDINHFNSLWADHESFYILAHNNGTSDIWHFSYPDLHLIAKYRIGNCGHNIWKQNDEIFTCNSLDGTIESVGGFRAKVGKFPRGIVRTENRFMVGLSDIAERSQRHLVSGAILTFDTAWNCLFAIKIEGHGQVLDIQAPGVQDIGSPNAIGKLPNIRWENIVSFLKFECNCPVGFIEQIKQNPDSFWFEQIVDNLPVNILATVKADKAE